MQPLHVRFEQTPEISYDFANYYWKSRKVIRWGMMAMVAIVVLLGMRAAMEDGEDRTRALTMLLPMAFILVLWRFLIPFTMKRQIDNAAASNNFGTAREMIFTAEGLVVKTEQSEATFAYEAIVQVGQSEMCYFLYIAHNQAMTLPKAALNPTEDEMLLAIFAAEEIPMV